MLLPDSRPVSDDELPTLYDWPATPWLRSCMVMAVDGSISGPNGLSGSISSRADRAVMAAIRSGADAYLVGAGTVRAEGYGPVRARPEHRPARLDRGQLPAPTLAIVSASCHVPWATARFVASDNPPLVLTTEAAHPDDRSRARAAGCTVVTAGETSVAMPDALAALHERGLTRVTCEGGPRLLGAVIAAGLLDEADLTLSPTLVAHPGGAATHEPPTEAPGADPAGSIGAALVSLTLHQLLEDDGFLFTRYLRAGVAA